MSKKIKALSKISLLHYYKLIFRSVLFIVALFAYIHYRINSEDILEKIPHKSIIFIFIWVFFVVEIILRFFPSSVESMGCQKQFAKNYKPIAKTNEKVSLNTWKGTFISAISWIGLNAAIGFVYFMGWITAEILLLISLAFSVCDMICILFFCPFQTWFMKNKCCTSCRIYNWDYAMMFTPLVFIPNFYTWSLVAFAVGLLIRWEVTAFAHPERFSEKTNACLSCSNCQEKLCHHKKQLRGFLAKNRAKLHLKGNAIIANAKNAVNSVKQHKTN